MLNPKPEPATGAAELMDQYTDLRERIYYADPASTEYRDTWDELAQVEFELNAVLGHRETIN